MAQVIFVRVITSHHPADEFRMNYEIVLKRAKAVKAAKQAAKHRPKL